MKKWLYGIIFLLPIFAHAEQKVPKIDAPRKWETKLNGVAYLPAGNQLSGIYGKSWPGMRFEISRTFNKKLGLQYWAGGDFVTAKGETKITKTKSKMRLFPVGMGLKVKRSYRGKVDYYTGGGPRYARMFIQNESQFVSERLDRHGYGGTLFSGANVQIFDSLSLNAQFDYSFLHFGQKEMLNKTDEVSVIASTCNISSGLKLKF